MASPQCFADEVKSDFQNDSETFEFACRDYVRQGREKDDAFFALAFRIGLDKSKASDRFREVARGLGLLAIAGSREMQAAAVEEMEKSAAIYDKEVPKIDEQIAKLQAKRTVFERDRDLSSKRVEHQRAADKQLPEFVPKVLKKDVGAAETILNTEGVGKTLRDATARHQELVCILNHGNIYNSPALHIEHGLRRMLPEAVLTTVEGRAIQYTFSPAWTELKSAAAAEFAELNQQLPALQSEVDESLAIIRKPLVDYWYNLED